jgi:3-oxoacyl-[acyl-carrier protein] reductase
VTAVANGGGRLDGCVAVVTGGGAGIGEAICLRLADDGASVVVVDVDPAGAETTAGLCGGRALTADVRDSERVEEVAQEVARDLGRVDLWVNNAGVASTEAYRQAVDERVERRLGESEAGEPLTDLDALLQVDDAEWRRMIAVHLDGTFFGMRAAARVMTPRRAGSIVNISSICGIAGCESHPHYSAAKAGVIGLTRASAKELASVGIRVNAIAPGYVDTEAVRTIPPGAMRALLASVPANRLGAPAEIAATVAFLASADAGYLVGQVISPNGGILTA